ncbi:dihydrolipoamide acetyltransferase family protein [Salinirarus marinus]|uniref:dihydrolipoamide acetyltransferase family protein n=1 Tax=Salinirarus marinus TaxID=3068310 RepID=UPI003C6CB84F
MTIREFKLPDVGEGVAEGELVQWLVEPGDAVSEDQPVAEVETDKALVEIPSSYDGTVKELRAEEGEMVPVGDVIITFEVAEEAEEPEAAGESEAEEATEAEATESEATEAEATEAETTTPGERVFAPPSTRRLARELDVDLQSVAGSGPGGRVTDADVRAAAEAGTERRTAESPEPRSVTFGSGTPAVSRREPDEPTVSRREPDEPTVSRREAGDRTARAVERVAEERASSRAAGRERTLATPATRRVAEELDVDIDDVPTEKTREGEPFVTAAMVHDYAESQRAAAETATEVEAEVGSVSEARAAEAPAETLAPEETVEATGGESGPVPGDRVPYRGVRRSIGEHMQRSKAEIPHAVHYDGVDVTDLVRLRERLRPIAANRGVKLTYMPFVLKAVASALREHPYMNASLDEDAEEIVLHDEYNVGVATATDAGLMVPVVRDVDEKGLVEIAAELNDKVERTRERTIGREEMQGGTFTVTNVGVVGGEYASPIVNHPEVGILAMGAIEKRPTVVDDDVVARHTLPLSLAIDHRVVDGAVAAEFTNHLKSSLSTPERLLLE